MNCKEIQDELLLHIGASGLPEDLQRHLKDCPECQSFWDELAQMSEKLGRDDDLYLDAAAVSAMVDRVDKRIDQIELEKVTDVRSVWKTYVPAAAAVILLVGMSLIVYMSGWLGGNGDHATLPAEDSLFVTVANGDVVNLDENDFEYILYQVSVDGRPVTGEMLFDDITEEELEYLEQNFDVGEIL